MAIALPVVAPGVVSLSLVIEPTTMLFALIAVRPILLPVTALAAIRFDVIAVRPILSPVIARAEITLPPIVLSAILSPVTEPAAKVLFVTVP